MSQQRASKIFLKRVYKASALTQMFISGNFSAHKKKLLKNFDFSAAKYDCEAFVQRRVAAELVQKIRDTRFVDDCASILDIGAGTGAVSILLADIFPNSIYHLNDISSKMLEVAALKMRGVGAEFVLLPGDAEYLNFHNKALDLIVSNFAFQWFSDIESIINRLSKIAKVIAFSIPIQNSFRDWVEFCKEQGLRSNPSDYLTFDEISKICLNLSPFCYHFDKISYSMSHPTPLHFMQHLRKLGAGTPRYDIPKKVLYSFVRREGPFIANYEVFFGILLCNQK